MARRLWTGQPQAPNLDSQSQPPSGCFRLDCSQSPGGEDRSWGRKERESGDRRWRSERGAGGEPQRGGGTARGAAPGGPGLAASCGAEHVPRAAGDRDSSSVPGPSRRPTSARTYCRRRASAAASGTHGHCVWGRRVAGGAPPSGPPLPSPPTLPGLRALLLSSPPRARGLSSWRWPAPARAHLTGAESEAPSAAHAGSRVRAAVLVLHLGAGLRVSTSSGAPAAFALGPGRAHHAPIPS
jgi:hypothetical protein